MSTTQMWLYEHADGRLPVVAPAGATFLAGDPEWHRVGPVVVQGADVQPTETQILEAAEVAGLLPNTVHAWMPELHRYHEALASTKKE